MQRKLIVSSQEVQMHPIMFACRFIISQFITFVLVAGQQPLWKSLLVHHMEWTGTYDHANSSYDCYLGVLSVSSEDQGVSYVTFKSGSIHLDMTVSSDDDKTVIMKEEATWNRSSHLVGHGQIVIEGQFLSDNLYYKFVGNMSSEVAPYLGTVTLRPAGKQQREPLDTNSHLQYGLAIGIPITLAVILIVVAALMLRWGIKKGYLRHVPWAYKHFTNPQRSRSNYEMDNHDSESGGRERESEQPAVHM